MAGFEQGPQARFQIFFRIAQAHPVIGAVQPRAAGFDAPGGQCLFQQGDEHRPLQLRQGVATQAVAVGAKFVGLFFVKTLE